MIILEFYCQQCGRGRPFNRSHKKPTPQKQPVVHRVQGKLVRIPSRDCIPNIPDSARLVWASCMVCDTRGSFVVTDGYWRECHFTQVDLCCCGLPDDHDGVCLKELRCVG